MLIPIPTAIDLVFTNMAPNNEMKKNYKKSEDITIDIQTHGLDEYLEFDNTGRYEFYKCGSCDGPILGHLQNKCGHKDPYDERTIRSFESDLRRIPELKKQVAEKKRAEDEKQAHHQTKRAEFQANMLGDTVKRIIAEMGPRDGNAANPTTQLVKARWPPIWTGQKFDKWRLEIEKWKENNKSTEEDKYVDLLESLKKN